MLWSCHKWRMWGKKNYVTCPAVVMQKLPRVTLLCQQTTALYPNLRRGGFTWEQNVLTVAVMSHSDVVRSRPVCPQAETPFIFTDWSWYPHSKVLNYRLYFRTGAVQIYHIVPNFGLLVHPSETVEREVKAAIYCLCKSSTVCRNPMWLKCRKPAENGCTNC